MLGLRRLLCYLGIHQVGNWTYRRSDLRGQPFERPSSIQHGMCQQCGANVDRLPGEEEPGDDRSLLPGIFILAAIIVGLVWMFGAAAWNLLERLG